MSIKRRKDRILMKKVIKVILALLLIFNIFSTVRYGIDTFGEKDIDCERVTITDKYEIGSGLRGTSEYMEGENEDGCYKIVGSDYDIGDTVKIYINADSAGAKGSDPQWYTSRDKAEGVSIAGFIFFVILTIINMIIAKKVFKPQKSATPA